MCTGIECEPQGGEAGAAPDAGVDTPIGEAGTTGEGGAPSDAGAPPIADAGEGGAPPIGEAAFSIVLVGNGSVAVTGAAACLTSPCAYTTLPNTLFELEAKAGADSRFVGWSGDCAGASAATSVTVVGATQCTATFVIQRAVAAKVAAAGGGTVETTPDLSCGAAGCQGEVDQNSMVTFTATPLAGYGFAGWTGGPECTGITQPSITVGITQDLTCTATFAKRYTLSVTAAGASADVGVAVGTCDAGTCLADAGSTASFHAAPLAGFRFTGWSGAALCTGTVNPLQISNVMSDIACVANYAARRTATGLVEGGGAAVTATSASATAVCTGNVCTLDAGTSATLVAPTIAGKRLTGWTGTGCSTANQSGNGIVVTPTTANVTCTATYATGVSVSGTVVGATGQVVAASTSPGAACTTGACGIDAGGSVTLTAPNLAPGYRFAGWTGDAGCTGNTLAITLGNVTASKACNANYVQQFVIAGAAGAGGTVVASKGGAACAGNSCTTDVNQAVTLTATANTAGGYHFTSWTGAGCSPAGTTPLVLSNVNATCTANFVLDTFTIAASAGTNGSVTATRADTGAQCAGASCTVSFGVNVSLAAAAAANYHFGAWSGAGCAPTGSNPLALKNLNASCAASFAINTFSAAVAAVPTAGGTVGISCPGNNCGAVPYNQLVNVTASPNVGWSFAGWSANCNGGTASPNAVTIKGNTSCTATFRPIATATNSPSAAGTITASATPNGSCTSGSPASCSVDSGGSVTFVVKAAANAVFTGWSGDCTGINTTVTLNPVAAPKSCTANFYQLWAQSTGLKGASESMTHVTALKDGTVVGAGLSLADGSRLNRLAIVDLDAGQGKLKRSQLWDDTAKAGTMQPAGLTTTANQAATITLGLHSSAGVVKPWLHEEQNKWELEYRYSNGKQETVSTAAGSGGDVITTLDGGYAFAFSAVDPTLGVAATHLTRVGADGKPSFDVELAVANADGAPGPLNAIDLLQDPATKNYVVLARTNTTPFEIVLAFIDEKGTFLGASRFGERGNLEVSQFVVGPNPESYLVVGTHTDAKTTRNGFYALLTRDPKPPSIAVSIGNDGSNENLYGIAKGPSGYGLVGMVTDAKANADAWVLMLDSTMKLKTQFGLAGAMSERASAITPIASGGFGIAGITNSWGTGDIDFWTLRVDSDGAITFNAASAGVRAATAFAEAAMSIATIAPNVVVRTSIVTEQAATAPAAAGDFQQNAQAP